MAAAEGEKKFVIRHSFGNVMNMKQGEMQDGPIQKHFNIPWRIRVWREPGGLNVFLDCMVPVESENWSIRTHTKGIVNGNEEYTNCSATYTKKNYYMLYQNLSFSVLPWLLKNGNLDYAFTVIIHEATGLNLNEPLGCFDDESAKEDSDVTLIVGDRKFHVVKNYLATHSSYFKALFFGNLAESGKTEIELKEIDPNDFQNFLEFLYLESCIEGHSVLGILHLADFFDAKIVVRRCQKFLVEKSILPLHRKFETAIKYNLEELKTKCISEMKTVDDLRSIVPENSKDFDSEIWKELFLKSLSINQK